MARVKSLGAVPQLVTAKTAAFDNSAAAEQSGAFGFNSSTAFDITVGKPKPGDRVVIVVQTAAGAGTHRIVPGSGVTIKEKDGTTSVTTAITFGTTAVAGTYCVLEAKDSVADTWQVVEYGTGMGVLPTGVSES
jgi:hypothetical protein